MAKTKISEYDSTAANNTDIDSINIAEGMAPSNVNNAIRELMAHLKDGLGAGTPVFLDQTNNVVGIGTSSPVSDAKLTLSDTNSPHIFFQRTSGGAGDSAIGMPSSAALAFYTPSNQSSVSGLSEAMRIDSSGNVGIGTTSPTAKLDVRGGIRLGTTIADVADGGRPIIYASDGSGSHTSHALVIQARDGAGSEIDFVTGTTPTTRALIDSSGKLLVGKTSDDNTVTGLVVNGNGYTKIVRASATANVNTVLLLNRLTTDGNILSFQKDGSSVGSISNSGTTLAIGNSVNAGIRFAGTRFNPTSGGAIDIDNSLDIGNTGARFDDIYATNGTIQTSDEREKQQIASLTDAEITAAKAISKLFKTFKWNDKVEAKGDAARTHTGVIAQQVETAMSDAGLDAGNYAFFISTTWWETQTEVAAVEAVEAQDAVYDDDGNLVTEAVEAVEAQDAYTRTDTYDTLEEAPEGATERNRKGIRYPELLSFIGAATEQRLTSIEARLDALEG